MSHRMFFLSLILVAPAQARAQTAFEALGYDNPSTVASATSVFFDAGWLLIFVACLWAALGLFQRSTSVTGGSSLGRELAGPIAAATMGFILLAGGGLSDDSGLAFGISTSTWTILVLLMLAVLVGLRVFASANAATTRTRKKAQRHQKLMRNRAGEREGTFTQTFEQQRRVRRTIAPRTMPKTQGKLGGKASDSWARRGVRWVTLTD